MLKARTAITPLTSSLMGSTYLETTQAGGIPVPIDVMPESKGRHWLLTRDFSLVWWSQVISQVGDGVTRLALLWFVYSITGSPLKTTVIGLLQTLPPILFGPLFGVCVDRLPNNWILFVRDLLGARLMG